MFVVTYLQVNKEAGEVKSYYKTLVHNCSIYFFLENEVKNAIPLELLLGTEQDPESMLRRHPNPTFQG